jgi:diguanylate cyclase (GGDEF)-like protein/PAS domain S-box-containing protein
VPDSSPPRLDDLIGLIEHVPVPMAISGLDQRWICVNEALAELTGYRRAELLALGFQGITHPDDLADDLNGMAAIAAGTIPHFSMRKRFLTRDGRSIWIDLWVAAVRAPDGELTGYVAQMRDMTADVELESDLAVAEMRFRRMFEDSPIGIVTATADRRFVRVNDAFCRIVGWKREELEGRATEEITHEDDRVGDIAQHVALASGDASIIREKRYLRPDGSVVWASVVTAHLRESGDETFFAQVVDVTARKQQVEALEQQAGSDSLTSLTNRRRFEAELAQHAQIAIRHGARGAVLMIDLDGFKLVNDSIGHREGDAVLVKVASILRHVLRGSDVAARFGGDEFAILLPEGGAKGAARAAERIVAAVVVPTAAGIVRASVGVATFDMGDTDGTGLAVLERADEALYAAKRKGGACFTVAQPGKLVG